MSIETDARQEAERRWPALNPGDVELTYPRGALRATARKAFEAGAVWAREKGTQEPSADRARVSDGAVQRVREAIYAQIGHYPTITAATEILSAALSGEQDTREPSEDPCPEWQCPDLSSEDRREGKSCPDHPCTCTRAREPSDAQLGVMAQAFYEELSTSSDITFHRMTAKPEIVRGLRAALLAAQEVRRG